MGADADKKLPILCGQYHGCWCPGDARSQAISNHNIDLVKPRKLGSRTFKINSPSIMLLHKPTYFLRALGHRFPQPYLYDANKYDVICRIN